MVETVQQLYGQEDSDVNEHDHCDLQSDQGAGSELEADSTCTLAFFFSFKQFILQLLFL